MMSCVLCATTSFQGGTGSQLPALRCSAVSALGTLCAKLRYALQPYLVDIIPTACHMLTMDEDTVRDNLCRPTRNVLSLSARGYASRLELTARGLN